MYKARTSSVNCAILRARDHCRRAAGQTLDPYRPPQCDVHSARTFSESTCSSKQDGQFKHPRPPKFCTEQQKRPERAAGPLDLPRVRRASSCRARARDIVARCGAVDRFLERGGYLAVLAASLGERLVPQLVLLLQRAWRREKGKENIRTRSPRVSRYTHPQGAPACTG